MFLATTSFEYVFLQLLMYLFICGLIRLFQWLKKPSSDEPKRSRKKRAYVDPQTYYSDWWLDSSPGRRNEVGNFSPSIFASGPSEMRTNQWQGTVDCHTEPTDCPVDVDSSFDCTDFGGAD